MQEQEEIMKTEENAVEAFYVVQSIKNTDALLEGMVSHNIDEIDAQTRSIIREANQIRSLYGLPKRS